MGKLKRTVPIVCGNSPMLCNLRRTGCVNDAKVRLYNNVWHARVCGGIAVALCDEVLAGDDIEDLASSLGVI